MLHAAEVTPLPDEPWSFHRTAWAKQTESLGTSERAANRLVVTQGLPCQYPGRTEMGAEAAFGAWNTSQLLLPPSPEDQQPFPLQWGP